MVARRINKLPSQLGGFLLPVTSSTLYIWPRSVCVSYIAFCDPRKDCICISPSPKSTRVDICASQEYCDCPKILAQTTCHTFIKRFLRNQAKHKSPSVANATLRLYHRYVSFATSQIRIICGTIDVWN